MFRIVFADTFNPVSSGDDCRVYEGPPYSAAELANDGSVNFTTGQVANDGSLTVNGNQSGFAISVLDDSGTIFARTNGHLVSDFPDSDNINFFGFALPYAISASDLGGFLPAVPFTQSGVTINTLNLSLGSGSITATGQAQYGSGFWAVTVNFVYTFVLEAVTKPVWVLDDPGTPEPENQEAVIRAESSNISVTGGNWFQSILLFFFRGTIKNKLEDTINLELSNSVNNTLSQYGPNLTPTARDVTIDSGGVNMQLTLLSPDPLCPGTAAPPPPSSNPAFASKRSKAAPFRLRPVAELRYLRKVRDQVLRKHPRGQHFYQLFLGHKREILLLMLKHPRLLVDLDRGFRRIREENPRVDRMHFSPTTVNQIKEVLLGFQKEAKAELAGSIQEVLDAMGKRGEIDVNGFLRGKK